MIAKRDFLLEGRAQIKSMWTQNDEETIGAQNRWSNWGNGGHFMNIIFVI
jgi:hypothetical protein